MHDEKFVIEKRMIVMDAWIRFKNGLKRVKTLPRILILLIYIMLSIIGLIAYYNRLTSNTAFKCLTSSSMIVLTFGSVIGLVVIIIHFGTPPNRRTIRQQLKISGLTNSLGLPPRLIEVCEDPENDSLSILRFYPDGIPLDEWMDKQATIEAALNITISSIRYEEGKRYISIRYVPAEGDLPKYIEWKNEYLAQDDALFVVGKGIVGQYEINLKKQMPHMLIGGSTESGKTKLLKLILFQALLKHWTVYIIDHKDGLDYQGVWQRMCIFADSIEKTAKMLEDIRNTMSDREKILKESGFANITDYNENSEITMNRIFLAVDEAADLLDTTGLDKEEKTKRIDLDKSIREIARKGRAYGIHLIICTQRPDANVINGQIKNNLGIRICGKADNVLSQIVLDNTSAADAIHEGEKGRFIDGNGTIFQAYLLNDGIAEQQHFYE